MNQNTRFYHFKRSAFLLEIGAGYVRVFPLDGDRPLYSQKESLIKLWQGMSGEHLRIDALEHQRLLNIYNKINLN